MYIEPGTNIKILKDCPLDTTYDHTIYFADRASQTSYFSGLVKYNLTNYTYQRVRRGVARVGVKADNLYDCNYMMFQNTNYGNKWFYAFIKSVEYVNNETSEIEFVIDVLQTWFFDYTLDYCFVEREHTATDEVGSNLVPENFDVGEYVRNGGYHALFGNLTELAVLINEINVTDSLGNGRNYEGIYGAGVIMAFKATDIHGINEHLKSLSQKTDNIQAIYTCPLYALSTEIPDGGTELLNKDVSADYLSEIESLTGNETLNGYRPKNKKMYSYPYNYMEVTNGSGNKMNLRYEFMSKTERGLYGFEAITSIVQPVQVICRPVGYKGSNFSPGESLALDAFPMCSWAIDGYQAYIAQTAVPNTFSAGLNALFAGISALAGGGGLATAIGGANALSNVTNTISGAYKAKRGADVSGGNFNSGSAITAHRQNQFYYTRCSVNLDTAVVIDDYFTRFGYAVKQLVIPNRTSRPHWNYVKTVGCTITGSIPCDDMKKICDIYDNGVTFWKKGSEIGQYHLDNSPGATS